MSFLADSARSELDTQAAIVAERVAVDYHEGAADFAFGKMPRYPKDPNYRKAGLMNFRNEFTLKAIRQSTPKPNTPRLVPAIAMPSLRTCRSRNLRGRAGRMISND